MAVSLIPTREAELRVFLQNVVDVTAEVETDMGVPEGTYQPMKDAAQTELDAFAARDKAHTAADTADKDLKTAIKTSGKTLRGSLKQIKNTLNVPTSVLDLLKINASASKSQDKVKAEVPLLKPKMKGIQPAVTGYMYGYDAMELWCCRADENEHTLLETITHLPYYDTRENVVVDRPENRSYFGRYMKRNLVVSGQGPTVDLTVPGGPHQ